jgi:hypothetical protein
MDNNKNLNGVFYVSLMFRRITNPAERGSSETRIGFEHKDQRNDKVLQSKVNKLL